MHRTLLFLLAGLVLLAPVRALPEVLVIGIDGASWNVIDPMLAEGELPHLARLIELGGSADLETVEPVTSPVVWTSIATGRSPEVHGVTDFFSTRATIAVPSIYERLAVQGKRVGLYDVLMSWPPQPLPDGFVVPGWLRRDETTWPPDALDGTSVFRTVYQAKPSNRDYLEQARREIREKAGSWAQLDQRFEPEVGALTFYAVDATSHRYWHASFPDDFEGETLPFADDERNAVQKTMRGIDQSIGALTAGLDLEGRDSVIVVSDHGFEAQEESGNVWITRFEKLLAKHDLVPGRDGFTLVSTFFAVSLRIAPGDFAERDRLIEKLTALLDSYRTVDGDPILLTSVLDVAERPAGMERSFWNRSYQCLVIRLMDWAFDTKLDPTAQAMIVALPRRGRLEPLWPNEEIMVDGERTPLSRAIHLQRFNGTHHPTAVFIAAGRGIGRQPERGRLSVLDIAPLVAYLADTPIPDDLEGSLPDGWIDDAHRRAHPPRVIAAEDLPRLSDMEGGADAEGTGSGSEDPELVEKLRALGYIE